MGLTPENTNFNLLMFSLQIKINAPLNVKPGTHTAQADNITIL